jgi:vacuolar iron transporter family protein
MEVGESSQDLHASEELSHAQCTRAIWNIGVHEWPCKAVHFSYMAPLVRDQHHRLASQKTRYFGTKSCIDMSTKAPPQPKMEHEHTREAIRQRLAAGPPQSYLRDWIYGGIDGVVTTFAIISGVVGARLASHVILILGSASLVADGFAMAAGNYLATRSEDEEFHHAEAVERRHIERFPEGEREEVREILRTRGIPSDLLDRIVASITADRNLWVRVMLRDEYGMPDAVRSPWRAAVVTFSAFLVCGLVPLVPFVAGLKNAFSTAAAVTGLMFVLIGAFKSRWSTRPWWYSGLMTLAIGGGAATVAYAIGAWLRGLTG